MRFKVRPNDNLFRLAIHPASHRGGKFFDSCKLFYFIPDATDSKTFETSLAWQVFVPTAKMLHEYGCRNAVGRNKRRAEKEGTPLKAKNRSTYWGSYHLEAQSIFSIIGIDNLDEIALVDITQKTENGELAHISFKFSLKPEFRGDPNTTITALTDRLWRLTRGPLKHICPEDADRTPHPSENAEQAPQGLYIDNRSSFRRYMMILQCHVLMALCRNFSCMKSE